MFNNIKKLLTDKVALYDKYWYVRQAYGRGLVHISIPVEVAGDLYQAILLATVLSLKFEFPIWLIIVGLIAFQIAYIAFRLWLGHKDMKKGWYARDTHMSNKYNPDIQEIKKLIKDK